MKKIYWILWLCLFIEGPVFAGHDKRMEKNRLKALKENAPVWLSKEDKEHLYTGEKQSVHDTTTSRSYTSIWSADYVSHTVIRTASIVNDTWDTPPATETTDERTAMIAPAYGILAVNIFILLLGYAFLYPDAGKDKREREKPTLWKALVFEWFFMLLGIFFTYYSYLDHSDSRVKIGFQLIGSFSVLTSYFLTKYIFLPACMKKYNAPDIGSRSKMRMEI